MNRLSNFRIFKSPILFGITVFLLISALTQFLTYQRYLILKNKEHQQVISQANWIEKEFDKILNQSFTATQTFAFIVENYGVPENFDSIAKLLLQTNKQLSAIELVDSTGVITHVYPLEGNELLGFNILKDSIGKKGANITLKRKDYFISGPIHLKQGGTGFVSRIPIFKENTFQGFSAAVIKLPGLLSALNIDDSSDNRFSYRLTKVNDDKSEELFFSTNNSSIKAAYNITVPMTNGEWKLYVISNNNKELISSASIFAILGIILSILAGVFAWYLIMQPARLDKMVEEKTFLLQESQEKFYKSFHSNLTGKVIVDEHRVILEANNTIANILETTRENLIGKPLIDADVLDYNLNGQSEKRQVVWNKLLEQGFLQDEELTYTLKSGKKIPALISIEPLKLENKNNYLVSAIDNTKRKEAETKLEAQNLELLKTNSELDRFVYSASHELRAPLASVLGLINIILSEEKEEGLVFKLEMMQQSVNRLDSFIKDIVQYSQNKHIDVAHEKIEFRGLVQDSLESLWYLENRSKINIQVKVSEEIDFYSDKKRISIVLNNLISNAIKYHNIEGKNPVIHIVVTTSENNVQIEINDNGVGIPEENLNKIFDMFYRVSSRVMGTGIGLYVVKEIIKKINGEITVESEENKGTSFRVILPNQMNKLHEVEKNTIN